MESSKIRVLIVLVFALCGAVYLGISAATAQYETVAWVVGIGILIILMTLGGNVWTVIPVAGALSGGLTFLPGFPQPWYVATPIVGGFMLTRFLLRSNMFQFRWTWLDTFILLQIGVLLQAYMRNPTGLAIFSDSVVGGRPYFDYAVAITSYFLLSIVKTDRKTFVRVVTLVLIVNLGDDLLRAITGFSGNFARLVGKLYTNVEYSANAAGASFAFDVQTTRFGGLMNLGLTLGLISFSFHRPLTSLSPIRPIAFLMLALSVVFSLFSGFRSSIIRLGCFFIAGTLIRKKPLDIFIGGAVGSVGILLFSATFGLKHLPDAAQRALSFLPFQVSESAKNVAQASSDWRFEMWRIVLTSDRYIKNKMLGDGFGYSKAEHEAQLKVAETGAAYLGDSIDMFIAKGSYHGWHVEAIRFTGVLGLVIGVILLFAFARYAWLAIRHFEGSKYYGYVVFICIPFLIEPFFHIFVFGSYKSTFMELIAAAGILRLIDNLRIRELAEARATVIHPVFLGEKMPSSSARRILASAKAGG